MSGLDTKVFASLSPSYFTRRPTVVFLKLETLLGGLAQEAHSAPPPFSDHTQVLGEESINDNKMLTIQEPGLPSPATETQLPVFISCLSSISLNLSPDLPMCTNHFTCLPATSGIIVSIPLHCESQSRKGGRGPWHPLLPDIGPLSSSIKVAIAQSLPSPYLLPPCPEHLRRSQLLLLVPITNRCPKYLTQSCMLCD